MPAKWGESDTFGNDLDNIGHDLDTFGNEWARFGHVWERFFEPPEIVSIGFAACYHFRLPFFRLPEIPLVGTEGLTHNL